MAIYDLDRKPFIVDNHEDIYVGIAIPFSRSADIDGYFTATKTVIEAVKVNIRSLMKTFRGERIFQPLIGSNLRQFMFEQVTDELIQKIKDDIRQQINTWLPFVMIDRLEVKLGPDEDGADGKNTIYIRIDFRITRVQNSLDSIDLKVT